MFWFRLCLISSACLLGAAASAEQEPKSPMPSEGMNNARIGVLLENLDLGVAGSDGHWRLVVADRDVMIITDEAADRMRIISPIAPSETLTEESLRRVMQANFDTALDARYAIAKGTLWSAFIHPLHALDDEAFLLGLGQVVNLVNTFGSSYTSGLLIFRGGDSGGIRERELLDELIEKGLAI